MEDAKEVGLVWGGVRRLCLKVMKEPQVRAKRQKSKIPRRRDRTWGPLKG